MKKILFITALLLLSFIKTALKAQDGTLDKTFGTSNTGSLLVPFGNNDDFKSVLVQPDGKIIAGGYCTTGALQSFYINRFNSNGSADATFNSGLPNTFTQQANNSNNSVEGMTLLDDGSLLYGGTTTTAAGVQSVGIGKINSLGIRKPGFSATSYTAPNGANYATGISYNKIADRIVLGGYIVSTQYSGFVFRFLNTGAPDLSFPTNGFESFNTSLLNASAIIESSDGSLLIAGTFKTANFNDAFAVAKVNSDGTFDTNFGVNGVAQVPIGAFNSFPKTMVQLPGGKILVAGSVSENSGSSITDIGLVRLNADGTLDNSFSTVSFNYSGGKDIANSMFIQPDKKIVVSGNTINGGASSGIIMRFTEDGQKDLTFGTSGLLIIPGAEINSSDISVKEGKAIFAGALVPFPSAGPANKLLLMKVNLFNPQKFNIIGKDIVSIATQNNYYVAPKIDGYTYSWSYSNSNIYTLGSNALDSLILYFGATTPSGTLTCNVYNSNGSLTQQLTKQIQVNPEPTLAELLRNPKCSVAQTTCETSYINSFSITQTKLKSTNTGCSATGYSDLTASGNYDTLYIGDNYQAKLQAVDSSGAVVYAGVWIDFNNDGQILDDKEFVGSTFSHTGELTINNIYIPASSEPGPKRVRVRVRESGSFKASEFCPVNNEISETEDYLVVFHDYREILAPNFITPNDDGKNDHFIVRGIKDDVKNNLKVFNRTGDLVYDKENYDNSWEGKDKNDGKLKPGTYYYVFTQDNPNKKKEDVVKGFLEIRY